jgi:hypothetical protein
MIGAFTGTIDQVAKDPSGYTRFSGITGYQGLGLGNVQALILYVNTQKQIAAMLSPVSRITSQELHDFENNKLSSKDIQFRIDHREQRGEPHEFVI